ncbi:MAG TPA: HD domain-containing phosphohydrolase [Candidatus Eisenbacteria bacterium]|nr:HD domain-containing phosphohydrolase [Candidatus Eisenbacteria bacterium]
MVDERILAVDDDPSVRDIVSSMLKHAGYECRTAASAQEAIAALQPDNSYALLLSDISMEGMDGFALLDRVRRLYPQMPVVMVTGIHDLSIALAAIRSGAYDYVLKPFERDQLLATVRRALETRRLKIENLAYQNKLESLVAAKTEDLQRANADLKRAMSELEGAMHELERSYDITLEALGDALDLKDKETEGHSKRVTAFTIAIARAMELPSNQVRVIARGAFLHDVGKMAIPDAILRKPGRLTPEEQMLMREHALLGYQMLRKIPFLREAAQIVYCHQERYDGSGYPRGLKGDQIPVGARIFAVADTFDAITSDRPYRAAQSIPAARHEIQKHAGHQFDPEVVETFMSISDDLWAELRNEVDAPSTSRKR